MVQGTTTSPSVPPDLITGTTPTPPLVLNTNDGLLNSNTPGSVHNVEKDNLEPPRQSIAKRIKTRRKQISFNKIALFMMQQCRRFIVKNCFSQKHLYEKNHQKTISYKNK